MTEMTDKTNAAGTEADLAGRLQALRRRRGISQEELAGAVGVSRQAVSKWESRQAQPETEKLAAICGFFGVSLDWLVLGREAESGAAGRQAGRLLPEGLAALATALDYIGLIIAWAVWDYWQISLSAALGAAFMILGAVTMKMALAAAGGDEALRDRLRRRFWLFNIWPVAYLAVSVVYGTLCCAMVAPVITFRFLYSGALGEFVFAWGAWFIICVVVTVWARKKK